MKNSQVKTLKVKDLCNDDKYIVPIYQRNYAWGKDEIELLIQDILEAQSKDKDKNYYIGSLVVSKRKDSYEVIDGQQRLTTLKLLLAYYDINQSVNLTFEHRDESNFSFKNLSGDNYTKNSIDLGYKIISNIFEQFDKQKLDKKVFFDFLLEKVVILRTEVPDGTDLNHYFEIMNNRGEQLEKHEVLKARLMNALPDNERRLFALIWDACSDMNVYAIKRFPYSKDNTKNIRTSNAFFGELCNKIPKCFNEMLNEITLSNSVNILEYKSILDLLAGEEIKESNQGENNDEMKDGNFNSIIDFPNFLMIVYRIFTHKNIPLNDKYLLNEFEGLKDPYSIKDFILCLLKSRLIFDRYIIKSKDEEDTWLLNGLKKYKNSNSFYFKEVNSFGTAFDILGTDNEENYSSQDNTQIIQLLSMFHTSFRQKIYKNWLFDVLSKLYILEDLKTEYALKAKTYIEILEKLAYDYYQDPERQVLFAKGGQSIPNYIFNYLDYLLWRNWGDDELSKDNELLTKDNFVFSLSRNSVEHYLPQSKRDSLLEDIKLDERDGILNKFGNLCLISHYQNSSLNDEIPSEKKKRYESGNLKCISPKQALMLSRQEWNAKEIEKHHKDMVGILNAESVRMYNIK
ncbi:DUF262 domain-containing protein [Mannheimia massilioguelmaensis]|uniref:DUF262 domain-containing protein n=1 Tax=Mannheimia massilioguelmaensis TaxID=1604354 RepID=UPI0005C83B54|nr:DUF262 domain-containing protein [Mannheimia massilioguelmaensis]